MSGASVNNSRTRIHKHPFGGPALPLLALVLAQPCPPPNGASPKRTWHSASWISPRLPAAAIRTTSSTRFSMPAAGRTATTFSSSTSWTPRIRVFRISTSTESGTPTSALKAIWSISAGGITSLEARSNHGFSPNRNTVGVRTSTCPCDSNTSSGSTNSATAPRTRTLCRRCWYGSSDRPAGSP